VDTQCCAKGIEVLAQAGMSLAVIIAQSPVGADQMNEDGGGDGLVYSVIALVGLAVVLYLTFTTK